MNNFPFAILEVQASGLPVIATRVWGMPEQVINGKKGFLIETANPACMRFTWPLTEKELTGLVRNL